MGATSPIKRTYNETDYHNEFNKDSRLTISLNKMQMLRNGIRGMIDRNLCEHSEVKLVPSQE